MFPSGFLNLNKPSGMTSRRAVDLVQRLARPAKVGHAGTLDPLASGVLVVAVGPATRLIEYVQRAPKRYRASFLLGRQSPTEDVEGDVTELTNPPVPLQSDLELAAARLTGRILQRPPAYSALKIEGRRAYALARRGEKVELEPRLIEVYRLDVVEYAYPELTLLIECSGGTYVRSLGRDLAESLGTAAVMSALVRSAVGSFRIDDAVDPNVLTSANWQNYLQPPWWAVAGLPRIELTAGAAARIASGQTIPRPPSLPAAGEYAAIDPAGRLLAILVPRGPGLLGPKLNLAPPS